MERELSSVREKGTRCNCQTVTKPVVKVEGVQLVIENNFSASNYRAWTLH